MALDDRGLSALNFDGRSFLATPDHGHMDFHWVLRRPGDEGATEQGNAPTASRLDAKRREVTHTFGWGTVAALYTQRGDRLTVELTANNTSDKPLSELHMTLVGLGFPQAPQGGVLDTGEFGFNYQGELWPLHVYPLIVKPHQQPPVIVADYGSGALAFSSHDFSGQSHIVLSSPYNPPLNTAYPFRVLMAEPASPLPPGGKRTATVELSFGAATPAGTTPTTGALAQRLAGNVLTEYRAAFPYKLKWDDRRPIGQVFLSGAGNRNRATNPRDWIFNHALSDVTNEAGRAEFARQLLIHADNSIKVLQEMDAQGMVAWDIEGQEYPHAISYIGEPHLIARMAPEMETPIEVEVREKGVLQKKTMPVVDAFFRKFREAGLRVGVTLRPQTIVFDENGGVDQGGTSGEEAYQNLKEDMEYAHKRWGCTLFYIDTTLDGVKGGPLDADIFERLQREYPDVLMMPENENLRYFAYGAPLNSFQHHAVSSTTVGVRAAYPQAFSVLIAAEGDFAGKRAELVEAVKRGDILLFHGWYGAANNPTIKSIYQEATKAAPKK